jgi:Chitobiase/beta-hexosaminidase C-terminal domain/Legume lectin domain
MKKYLFLALIVLGFLLPASAQISCPSGFASSGTCGVSTVGSGGQPLALVGTTNGSTPGLNGSRVDLIPNGATHAALSLNYQKLVNVNSFTASFTFVPNGQNIAFVLQNSNNNPYFNGASFSSGAGCEAGFFQAFGQPNPNNIFALELDSWSYLGSAQSFSYSSAQIYQSGQSPCNPNDSGPNYTLIDKISTSPVALNSPASSQGTSTGDVYSATITYNGSTLTLNLYDVTAGGACPGTNCFTYTWNVNIPSWVGANTAYVGFTAATGETSTYPLYIGSFSYTEGLTSQAAAPTFSPAGGTYTGSQSVTLSTASSGAVICYNTTGSPATNGSTGCASGTLYAGPVTVSSSETVYAVAGGTGYTDSPVGSASYVIQSSVATPTFSPAAGTYSSTQSVTISDSTANATIYYTTDGTTPTPSSTKYTGTITVSSTETLKAIAVATGSTNSAVASAAYTITPLPVVATPTFSPAAGSYNSAQSVTISDATSGAIIYYTTNGTMPTTSSTEYTGPITVSATETLEALAVAPGDTNSAVASAAYTINSSLPSASTPTFSPAPGTYPSAQPVTISDATSDATIYYTTNGTTPTTSSTEYTGPITVSSTETLEAIAAATGDTSSGVGYAPYTITSASLPSASTPTFSPAAGAYTSVQTVTISDATSSATIYYTTNGTAPTTSSTQYSGPITVSSTDTLEAIAVAQGDTNSAVASAAYTINSSLPSVSTPTFSPAPGTYTSAQTVTISDATSDATIYYTSDGTTPTTSSTKYSGPITVSATETLQAIAATTGDSAIASAAYTITSQPNFMLATSPSSLTVNSGAQGTVMLTVTPVNGFSSPVILACSGLPAGATCSFDQATVTPSGGAATTQLTISTSPQSSTLPPASRPFFPVTALALTVCLFGWRRRGWHHWLLVVLAFAGLGILSGCTTGANGGAGTSSTTNPTPATSTVTVTAISGTLQGKAAIALTVN